MLETSDCSSKCSIISDFHSCLHSDGCRACHSNFSIRVTVLFSLVQTNNLIAYEPAQRPPRPFLLHKNRRPQI